MKIKIRSNHPDFNFCFWALGGFDSKACENLQPKNARQRAPINSSTQPHAYAFLNRLCTGGEAKQVDKEILDMWRSKGPQRNRLLEMFVTRCYNREEDQSRNRAKLEALVRFKQCSKEFKKSMQGFSWLTESEMKEKKME